MPIEVIETASLNDHASLISSVKENGTNLDWFSQRNYDIISDINEAPKYSLDYYNCTGLVLFGISKENKQNISLLTHQSLFSNIDQLREWEQDYNANPWENFGDQDQPELVRKPRPRDAEKILKKSIVSLTKKLVLLKQTSLAGSIDALMFGGQIDESSGLDPSIISTQREHYAKSVSVYSRLIYSIFGLQLRVLKPKDNQQILPGSQEILATNIYVNTPEREVLVVNQNKSVRNEETRPSSY